MVLVGFFGGASDQREAICAHGVPSILRLFDFVGRSEDGVLLNPLPIFYHVLCLESLTANFNVGSVLRAGRLQS